MSARHIAVLFALGAFVGTLGDLGHVLTETLHYPPEGVGFYLGVQPFWVPLLFGGAAVAIGVSHRWADRRWPSPDPRPGTRSWLGAGGGVAVFLLLYVLSGLIPTPFADPVLLVGGSLSYLVFDRSKLGMALAVGTAVVGVGVESVLIAIGAFAYAPDLNLLWLTPTWLPWLYVAASVACANVARRLG